MGASALFLYFDPYNLKLGLTHDEFLVDGAIIAEDPALYSLIFA